MYMDTHVQTYTQRRKKLLQLKVVQLSGSDFAQSMLTSFHLVTLFLVGNHNTLIQDLRLQVLRIFFFFTLLYFMLVCVSVFTCMPECTCGDQRVSCRSFILSSTKGSQGNQLRSSAWQQPLYLLSNPINLLIHFKGKTNSHILNFCATQ